MEQGRNGLTLIEVVASIALLSTLLVMMLSIRSGLVRQANQAYSAQQAVEALDMQLATWLEVSGTIPLDETGDFDSTKEFYWRTFLIPTRSSNDAWKIATVRVEAVSVTTQEPIASVELAQQPAETSGSVLGEQQP